MGQAVNVRNDVALDTVISNIVIVDSVSGIIKADLGIKVYWLGYFLESTFRKSFQKPR